MDLTIQPYNGISHSSEKDQAVLLCLDTEGLFTYVINEKQGAD